MWHTNRDIIICTSACVVLNRQSNQDNQIVENGSKDNADSTDDYSDDLKPFVCDVNLHFSSEEM